MSTEWNGKGAPPVGAEVLDDDGQLCRVVGIFCGFVMTEFVELLNSDRPIARRISELSPIRSAEQVAVEAMAKYGQCSHANETAAAMVASGIYAAIRDGKIPGVKLED